jgi:uncharacterized damage-inducible protein DinB
MISLETSIKHLAWSNQKFFALFEGLPESAFALRAADGEWTIGTLLFHIAGSESWYRYCLTGIDWIERSEVTNHALLRETSLILAELDSALLSEVDKSDESLVIKAGDETIHATRSLILSQAVMHASEHKGQIATILKQNGHHLD